MQATDTDLFAPLPVQLALIAPHTRKLIVCLVCRAGGWVSRDYPRLCEHCASDLPATRAFIVNIVLRTEMRRDATLEAFNAALDAADAATIKQYTLYTELRGTQRAVDAETKARSGDVAPVFALIRLWLDYRAAMVAYIDRAKWQRDCEAIL